MNEQRKKTTHLIPRIMLLLPVVLLTILILLGVNVWNQYRTALMNNQTDQLLLISKALSQNMEVSLQEYENSLAFLSRVEESGKGTNDFYDQFLRDQGSFNDVQLEDAQGICVRTAQGMKLSDFIHLAQPSENVSYWQCRDEDGSFYLSMKHRLSDGSTLSLIVDEEQYYENLISDIHVGTNGYIVIKGADEKIIMHPSKEQWGIHVIEGRKELFPGLDYSSLSKMIEEQVRDESGIYEYTSYWWVDPDLPQVKKVSAHAHVKLGEDFWIVSAVVDYSDFYTPIASGFQGILMVFLGVLALFLIFALMIGKLVTDRQKATSEIEYLRELNETLEELHRSEESLAHQQRLQVMGAMTGGIAHEFNNFLTPIMGHADILMAETVENSELYDSAREIYEASEKAKDAIRQIASMSRKNVETVYRSIDARKMLEHNVKMQKAISMPNIRIQQEIQLKDERFLGNATQIHQVLLNIFNNAIQAVGEAEGTITMRARCVDRSVVKKRFASEKVSDDWSRYIQVDVADNGCGMDAGTLRHVFEPFFTTKKAGEGTGLGLSIADQVIRTHRGFICASSVQGEGTVFSIFLPVLEQGMETEYQSWDQLQELKLVMADDNHKILELMERRFEKVGLKLRTCSNRNHLRQLLQVENTDVLAIDESLEDADGIDFCMSIQDKYPEMIKIIMTNTVTREVVEAKRRHIIDDYILKPVSDTTLLASIRGCQENRMNTNL